MKKTYKRILNVSGALIVLTVVLSIAYLIKARSVIKEMTPVETREIPKDVFAIRDSFSNFYLIRDGEHYIALDAGNDRENILTELKKLAVAPEKVIAVMLTHTDGDHVAGISLFKNADVYLSRQEEQMIKGETSRFFILGNKIKTEKYRLVEDQQTLKLGNVKIEGFLTPGHTPGSMCYLVNDTLLFTGDALRLDKGAVKPFIRYINMDSEMADQSIAKIAKMQGVQYIFTAHYGYTDNFNDAVKGW